MSVRGVAQLRQLLIRYSDIDGSSAGVRQFLSSNLRSFAESYPNLTIKTEIKRNSHPIVQGEYITGNDRVICVKNQSPESIVEVIHSIRTTSGRPVKRLKKPVITETPTIQGFWNPDMEYKVQIKE